MSQGSVAWRRVARGMGLVGVGCFLLASTSGWLPWSFWGALLPLWPVLLIALGIRLVFERTRLPWLVLLAPALVLGTMAWVAVGGTGGLRPTGVTEPVQVERTAGASRWVLEAEMAHGELDLAGRVLDPSLLLEGEATATGSPARLRLAGGGTSPRVILEGGRRYRAFRLGNPWSRWRLDLAEDLPVALDLRLALTSGRLDLAGVPVASLDLEGALNDLDLRLGRPDQDVSIWIEGALSSLRLEVPAGVPVRSDVDGAFNMVRGERGGEGPGYRIRVDGAFNRVDVRAP